LSQVRHVFQLGAILVLCGRTAPAAFASNWAEHCGTLCGSTTDIEDYLIDARGPQSSP